MCVCVCGGVLGQSGFCGAFLEAQTCCRPPLPLDGVLQELLQLRERGDTADIQDLEGFWNVREFPGEGEESTGLPAWTRRGSVGSLWSSLCPWWGVGENSLWSPQSVTRIWKPTLPAQHISPLSLPQQDCDVTALWGLGPAYIRCSVSMMVVCGERMEMMAHGGHLLLSPTHAPSDGELESRTGWGAHLCTTAWNRCRRAVQSLPPLKPTQS